MAQKVHANLTGEAARRLQLLHHHEFLALHKKSSLDSAMQTQVMVMGDSPVDQGGYKNAWKVVRVSDETRLQNDSPIAGVIENGARPFWPPLQPLIEWVRRNTGYFDGVETDDDIEGVARGVQRAIAKRGFAPKYIMRNRLNFAARALKRSMESHLEQWIRRK